MEFPILKLEYGLDQTTNCKLYFVCLLHKMSCIFYLCCVEMLVGQLFLEEPVAMDLRWRLFWLPLALSETAVIS